MGLFKKKGSKNYPLSLLGDNNLAGALEIDTTSQFSFPVGKDEEAKDCRTNTIIIRTIRTKLI